jgi:hypothetical protein
MFKTIYVLLALCCGTAGAAQTVDHSIKAAITPETGVLQAEDRVTLASPAGEFVFSLHKGLAPRSESGALETLPAAAAAKYGINFSSAADIYETYRLTPAKPASTFVLNYSGVIDHPLGEQAEEYARSFSETPGLITKDGCYLSGASGWYPAFGDALVTFHLEVSLPKPYAAVSGGERTSVSSEGGTNRSVWREKAPQDEINLACGPYTEYARRDAGRDYYAFLRSPDPELAGKYLDAAAKYTAFYSALLGPYPYAKFALAENFWETGYGVPSFTLLGGKVIRLPFIINSSYPHEILHNWWGNGVFVDYAKGNWCEGLTAYLADYLIAENRGKGAEYRRTELQKYTDYAAGGKDFPLTAFRSRHSSAEEAVGYGKALMFYHMLRELMGDRNFLKGLRAFYADDKFRAASFGDLRKAFETVSGPGRLAPFFAQWVERTGAPRLALKNVRLAKAGDYDLDFTITQEQDGAAYALRIPAAIWLEGSDKPRMKLLEMDSKEETYHYTAPFRPVRIEIDPEFDVFRVLDPLETPPTLSRLLGAAKPAILVPAGQAGTPWLGLAAAWTKDKDNLPLVQADTAPVPGAASYWLFGAENARAPAFQAALARYGARFAEDSVTLDNRRFPLKGYTFVFAAFNPADPRYSGALVLSGAADKLPLLAAKLPHYGKYSWLVFDENMNSAATGVWRAASSPLAVDIPGGAPPAAGHYPAREPLAWLPSPFSAERMLADVKALAGLPGGRASGTEGQRKAAAFIAAEFKKAGLKPFDGKDLRQASDKPGSGNVVGMAEGTAEKDKYLVLSAHYDHLPVKDGAAYPGADDNASGIALLLELARWYGAHPAKRTIVFAAFDGEETGRAGSKYFAGRLAPALKARINADINFDTVGRLNGGKLLALNGSSSDKWVHIFRGAGFVTGTDYDMVKEDLDSSDQVSFIENGIPAVQFFSGPNTDYHRPTDTADKIDARGMVKEAEFAVEIADYLAGDSDFITRPQGAAAPRAQGDTRKVYTGLVPDFSFQGRGVRAQDITPGSPLAAAGLKAGDVILKLDGAPTDDLRGYSAELKKLNPGAKVTVTYLSDGAEKTAVLETAAR